MTKLQGADKALRRLRRLNSPAAERRVGKALFAAADALAVDAALSITEGSVSGKGHIPSSPGETPSADTHLLDRSIEAVQTGVLEAEVSANAPYAAPLEFGSSKAAARPFMAPAAERIRPKAAKFVAEAISREIRKG